MRMAWLPGHGTYQIDTSNDPYNPEAGSVKFTNAEPKGMEIEKQEVSSVDASKEAQKSSSFQRYLEVASFANLATVRKADGEKSEGSSEWIAHGDPTEIAIRVFVERFGQRSLSNSDDWEQLAEFPFDSSVKKMSVLCQDNVSRTVHVFTKGAVERVIGSCSTISTSTDALAPITAQSTAQILENMEALARQGLRVLALASRSGVRSVSEAEIKAGIIKRDEFEHDLVFRGLIGIYDPPRPESRPSVFKCHQAGISVHMLTGDHPETARAIAREVGILPSRMDLLRQHVAKILVMTAHDFDRLTDDEVDQLPQLPLVVARCAPNTKVRMIDALHRRGQYVAMTGDGVNDSPSLKRADVGIAMGLAGSDVAKR